MGREGPAHPGVTTQVATPGTVGQGSEASLRRDPPSQELQATGAAQFPIQKAHLPQPQGGGAAFQPDGAGSYGALFLGFSFFPCKMGGK